MAVSFFSPRRLRLGEKGKAFNQSIQGFSEPKASCKEAESIHLNALAPAVNGWATEKLNLNLIAERDQTIDRRANRAAQENQIRTFLEKQDAFSFLIQIDAVNIAHGGCFAATQTQRATRQQPRAPRLKTRSVFEIQRD